MTHATLLDNQTSDTNETLNLFSNKEIAMNTTTETTVRNNSVFETKEEYLAFRSFWRQLFKDKKHLKQPEAFYDWKGKVAGYHRVSALGLKEHLIFLAASGKNMDKAFETMQKHTARNLYGVSKSFALFGSVIDEKYHKAISDRIEAFLQTKK